MKICYINPTNTIRRPIAELAEILANQGHKIGIMFPSSTQCKTRNWAANEKIQNKKIEKIPVKSTYLPTLRYSITKPVHLLKQTKYIFKNYDKIHIWEYYYPISIFPLFYALLTRQRHKVILTTDGFVGYSYKPKEPWWMTPAFKIYTQTFARFLFKIPNIMTTYGKPLLPYAKQAGVPMKKLKVIPTGIHVEKIAKRDLKKIQEIKQEFRIKPSEKIILYVGMLTKRKGIDIVIKVSEKLLKQGHNIKTILVGDNYENINYQAEVSPKDKDKILFAGGRKDRIQFMHLANVLLLPSLGEGLPGVVMEAMATNLPVIATREGCTPDLIENNKQGFLISKEREIYDYMNKVKLVITHEKKCKQGQKKISLFSWDSISLLYQKIYKVNRKKPISSSK